MMSKESLPSIFTPEQAARYLQINRETIYRYIRQGRLDASKLGRSYRIPRQSIDLLLQATRTRQDIRLREYTEEQLEQFARDDTLDEPTMEVVKRFIQVMDETEREKVRGKKAKKRR